MRLVLVWTSLALTVRSSTIDPDRFLAVIVVPRATPLRVWNRASRSQALLQVMYVGLPATISRPRGAAAMLVRVVAFSFAFCEISARRGARIARGRS